MKHEALANFMLAGIRSAGQSPRFPVIQAFLQTDDRVVVVKALRCLDDNQEFCRKRQAALLEWARAEVKAAPREPHQGRLPTTRNPSMRDPTPDQIRERMEAIRRERGLAIV